MNFKDFCQPFYSKDKHLHGLKTKSAEYQIAIFFLQKSVREEVEPTIIFADTSLRKMFSGKRPLSSEMCETIVRNFDKIRFSNFIFNEINEAALPQLMAAFEIQLHKDELPDKFAFSSALAQQFLLIAEGNNYADNVVRKIYYDIISHFSFGEYVINSREKYSRMKTILYTAEEHDFYDFFVCNGIHYQCQTQDMYIESATLEKLLNVSRYTLLIGTGGIGKTMMMRHLFLDSIKKYSSGGLLPVLVVLRDFRAENDNIFQMIVDSVIRFDESVSDTHIQKMMREGKCQILLDGLDEVRGCDIDSLEQQMEILLDRYPKNQYVISARDFSDFIRLSRFKILHMLPLTQAQSLELIDRLEYCPEEPKLKQKFRENLIHEYFSTHSQFAENPMLLTLMLMNYQRFADVPAKKHLFYEQAYQTLLFRHDSSKLAYKRIFHSVEDPADFTLVFREFCAKSCRRKEFEFDKKRFEWYFKRLHSVKKIISPKMTAENFLFDACHTVCVMYEEGDRYYFLHKSFPEYFFADYYSRQDDATLEKLRNYLINRVHTGIIFIDNGSELDMLYELAPEKTEKFLFLPVLDEIFVSDEREEQYWQYLISVYASWEYILLNHDIINQYDNEYEIFYREDVFGNYCSTTNVIYKKILQHLKQDTEFCLDIPDEQITTKADRTYYLCANQLSDADKPTLVIQCTLSLPFAPEMLIEKCFRDENQMPVIFGEGYSFRFQDKDEEYYSELVDFWNNENCPAQKTFETVKEYYRHMKFKYLCETMLDDDF